MNLPLFNRNCLVFHVLLLLGGAGCATLPVPGPTDGGFNLRGKLGIVHEDQRVSARILWQQRADAFVIDLWGPLGQGRVRLTGNDDHLELHDGDGSIIDRGPSEAVMQRHLGWSLPLAVLPQWVRGRVAPGVPVRHRRLDEAGRLSGFRQLGWEVELERYQPVAEPATFLPYRLTARRDAYRLRLAVSDWEI